MNLISPEFEKDFDALRVRTATTKRDFKKLFAKLVNDQWPMQFRVSDYAFLDKLEPRERDAQIVRNSIRCWLDIKRCAIEVGYTDKYVCCITFTNEDKKEFGIIWPEILFLNNLFDPLKKLRIKNGQSKLSEYVFKLCSTTELVGKFSVLEEQCNNPQHLKIYIDIDEDLGETRRSLWNFRKLSSP